MINNKTSVIIVVQWFNWRFK